MRTRTVRSAISLSAGLGLLVSLFAAAEYYAASLQSACTLSGFISCAAVANSGRTTTLGIPDYLWGVGGFVALLVVAAVAERNRRDPRPPVVLAALASAAVALSVYFLYVQLGEIHALCLVCATAEGFGFLVWGFSLVLLAKLRRRGLEPAPADADAEGAVGPP